ncbi:MAG: site-specific integrase [Ruminiclostridium sp.]|nr:site-specific integrase [Ruminiclostridium sp.]
MNRNIYQRRDGRFEARLSLGKDENGKRHYRSFYGSTYAEAENKLLSVQEKHCFDISLTEITVKELSYEYLQVVRARLKESSIANYSMKLEKHIIPELGNITCCLLRSSDVSEFIDRKLKSGLSARYVSDIVVLLKSIFRYASRTYGIKNPTEAIAMSKRTKTEIEILNSDQQTKLLNYLRGSISLTSLGICISLYTGIRIGELCALQWRDIDFDNCTIKISKTIQRIQHNVGNKKTKLIITEPKSQSSVRTIPIPRFLMEMLCKAKSSSECFVLSGNNKPVEPRAMQYRFAKLLKKVNLPSVHFHSLRHAFATNCIALGFDVKTLSEILGHSSVEITLNRYVHSSMDRKRAYMGLLKWAA